MGQVMNRVAVVGGVRTPFVKAGGPFAGISFQGMGAHVLKEIVSRWKVDVNELDEFVFGSVLLDPRTPNWAREILFAAGLPKTICCHAVSNNCISGMVAITSIADRIQLGKTRCGIAGGAESMSNPPLLFSPYASRKFLHLFQQRTFGGKMGSLLKFRPKDFLPNPPGIAEPSTGLTMGQHAEITAQKMNISRVAQDELAFLSHQNAAKATKEGFFTSLVLPMAEVNRDLLIRADTSREKLASLRPVFDRSEKGTLTAGNSSPLTDGASVVLLMSEEHAKKTGRDVLAVMKDYEYSAIAPDEGLLMAPAVAVPRLLRRHGLNLESFDRIEIHEAFAAQVESNIQAWEQGWKEPSIGKLPRERLNVHGGSVALGHPFSATGGRLVAQLAKELAEKKLKRGLISICAAGAMAGAMILERD